jgi:hypothetical protein
MTSGLLNCMAQRHWHTHSYLGIPRIDSQYCPGFAITAGLARVGRTGPDHRVTMLTDPA